MVPMPASATVSLPYVGTILACICWWYTIITQTNSRRFSVNQCQHIGQTPKALRTPQIAPKSMRH